MLCLYSESTSALGSLNMKAHNKVALGFLFLIFSMVTEVQALQSNGHLPQCPNTAPQVVIQAIAAAAPGQGNVMSYKGFVVIVVVAIVGAAVGAAAGAGAGAGAGYAIEKEFVNENVTFVNSSGTWAGTVTGAIAGAIVGVIVVGGVMFKYTP